MKQVVSVFTFFLFFCSISYSQNNILCDSTNVYEIVEIMPLFPGGDAAFAEYLRNEIKYPSIESDCSFTSSIYLSFVVDTSGETTCAEILRPEPGNCILQNGFGDSLISLIYRMPRWTPGMQNHRKVRVRMVIPLRIDIEE